MRQMHFRQPAISPAAVDAVAGGRQFSASVHREYCALLERRSQKRARFVRQMMLDIIPAWTGFCGDTREPRLQMMRGAVVQLALRVLHVLHEKRRPWSRLDIDVGQLALRSEQLRFV